MRRKTNLIALASLVLGGLLEIPSRRKTRELEAQVHAREIIVRCADASSYARAMRQMAPPSNRAQRRREAHQRKKARRK